MIGGLYVIDGIDVMATLVPEEDAWQFEAAETCIPEAQLRDRERESIVVVDYEDPSTSETTRLWTKYPSATETIETHDARTGVKLHPEEVRKGQATEVRELDECGVEMEVDESELRVTLGKKIWSQWVETRKGPASSAVRCRLCATEVDTVEPRPDTFAATPPLKLVRLILNWAASDKPKLANAPKTIAAFDISAAFFRGKVRKVIYMVPPKNLRKKWKIWRLLEGLYGTLDASQAFPACVEKGLSGAQCWKRLVCTGETTPSSAFQMTGQTILSN